MLKKYRQGKPEVSQEKKKVLRKRYFFMFCFLAFPILNFIVFYIYANFNSILMAFQRPVFNGSGEYVWTLENFRRIVDLFGDAGGGVLLEATINTFLFWLIDISIVLPITTLSCYFFHVKIPGHKFFRAIMYLPNIIASSALVVLYKYAIGFGGPVEALMGKAGSEYHYALESSPSAIIAILIYTVIFGLGGKVVIIGGAMHSINDELLEAGRIDGCNWFQELVRIILPSIWPTLSTIILLSVIGILGATGPILAFTQGEAGTMTLSFYIYKLVVGIGAGGADLNLAAALGILMTIVTAPIALVVNKVLDRKGN